MSRTVFRTCTLCEAMCGLTFEVDGPNILSVAPDEQDVFSVDGLLGFGVFDELYKLDKPRLRFSPTPGPAGAVRPAL